ncbi:MAG: hypothetical protein JWM95_1199 [Gemmatimonadetes bacterium]|nr:hypothetical protein [Gemmatimonadota bacterium]
MNTVLGLQLMDSADDATAMEEMRSTFSICCSCTTDSNTCTACCSQDGCMDSFCACTT